MFPHLVMNLSHLLISLYGLIQCQAPLFTSSIDPNEAFKQVMTQLEDSGSNVLLQNTAKDSVKGFKVALVAYLNADRRRSTAELSYRDSKDDLSIRQLDELHQEAQLKLTEAASALTPTVAAKLALKMGPVEALLDRFTLKLRPSPDPYHSYVGRIIIVDPLAENPDEWFPKLVFACEKFRNQPIVGMDLEFGDSRPKEGEETYVAVIQLALPDLVLILRTPRKEQGPWRDGRNGLPNCIRRVISSEGVTKVTIGSRSGDISKLKSSFDLTVPPESIFELQEKIKEDVESNKVASFSEICSHFGYNPLKHDDPQEKFSWDERKTLPSFKVKYAAEDAFFPLLIHAEMQGVLGKPELRDHLLDELRPSLAGPDPDRSPGNSIVPRQIGEKAFAAMESKLKSCDKLLMSVVDELLVWGMDVYRVNDGSKDGCTFRFCLKGRRGYCSDKSLKFLWLKSDVSGKGEAQTELEKIKNALETFLRDHTDTFPFFNQPTDPDKKVKFYFAPQRPAKHGNRKIESVELVPVRLFDGASRHIGTRLP